MQIKNAYKESVIHKINQCLRRPAEQKKIKNIYCANIGTIHCADISNIYCADI